MRGLYPTFLRTIAIAIIVLTCWSSTHAATFTVTNLNNAGSGSLRQAILNANGAGAGPHLINFSVAGTIPIATSLPAITNPGITINGGGNITINSQGGNNVVDPFIINASNTTVTGFTVQNSGNVFFQVAANLSNVTIQDIIANHVQPFVNVVVLVNGASTNMTIKNLMALSGMEDCSGLAIGRALYFQNGTQTNLLIEDVTINAPCEGIVFRDASVNNLDIINTTVYGSINHIVFGNSGGPVETANDVTIDGENTASLYSQRDGAGGGMIYSNFVNTNWQIKNLIIDNDVPNNANDADYGIRFDNTTSGITIDNVTVHDAEIYGMWFNGAATNITIQNSTLDNFDGWIAAQLIRFENSVNTLNITNTVVNLDQSNTTDDGDYGIVFASNFPRNNINLNGLTVNEADDDGVYCDGVFTNFTLTNSTFTKNTDGIEFRGGYTRSNINITNSTFTGHNRSGILISTAVGSQSGTISGNTITTSASHGIWFYGGDGAKNYTVTNNTITANGGAGIYVNSGPDAINITQNSIFKNAGLGIELDGGGNLSYEGANRPTVTGSNNTMGNIWQVTVSLPTICNASGGCTVEVFANNSSDDPEGHFFVQSFSGLAAGSHVLTVNPCTAAPCTGVPYGFWTATLKVVATGSVSEFSNKYSMRTQGPAAVNTGIALWLDAQDAASGNLIPNEGWQDRSGLDRDFNIVSSDPNRGTSGLNYNHYITFDGNDFLRSNQSPFVNGFTAGEVIVVTRAHYRHINNGGPYDFGAGTRNEHYVWNNEAVYNSFGTTDRFGWLPSNRSIVDAKAGISSVTGTTLDVREWNIFQTYSAANQWGTGFNGQFVATSATNTTSFALAAGNEHIGAVSGFTFYGDIAEVILYSRTLTTTERRRINSYLALKYGTTLDQTTATNYVASDGTSTMWVNDGDAYKWNIFGIGRDNASGLHQKQSESIEQNAILSVGIGSTIAATNEANTASISTDKSFLTFADDNQLQRFGPAVTATNSNFRMHRTWKVDKFNFADANVTFQFGQEFGGNYLLLSSNATFTGITSEILLDSLGRATFNSSLLAHNSYFTVGAKMQLPGCVTPPVVSYPNYQEYYNDAIYPFGAPVGSSFTNALYNTQSTDDNIVYSGYYGRNFTNSFDPEFFGMVYRAKLNITTAGNYTFYTTSDNNSDILVDGQYVAGVVTCCYTASGVINLTAGVHDIEVRMADGGGPGYVTAEYQGPSVARQVIPLSALSPYTAPGVQTWLKADQGVTNSGGVIRWNDVSGNNNDAYQTNATFNPTYNSGNAINFNPAVNAATGAGMLFQKTIPPTSNLQMFAVGKIPSPAVRTLLRGIVADHFGIFDGSNNYGYFDSFIGFKNSGQTATTNIPYLIGMSHNAAANTAQPRFNGKNGTVLTGIDETEVDYYQHFLNVGWQGGNQGIGDVAEFVAVSGTLTATDIQKIESYLALKYGITIDQTTATDYLASNGTTKMWTAADNVGYNKDIAGIGRDNCQNLYQKQSKSSNGTDPITLAAGDTIRTTNALNPVTTVADNSFLTWANNNGATTGFTVDITATGINATTRIARIWKVDKTNWTAPANLTINFQGANADYYLLISNDPTFVTGVTEYRLNAAGNRTFPHTALPDGAYFTFGKRLAGPACVNAGIKAWYRADDGITTGAQWSDYSGNSNDATQATVTNQPVFTNAAINFNPALDFTNDDYFRDADGIFGTGTYTSSNVFVVQITDAIQNQTTFFENTSLSSFNALIPWSDGNLYWDPPITTNRVFTPWGGTVGTPYLWSLTSNTAGAGVTTGRFIHRNRTQIGGNATAPVPFMGLNAPFNIGRAETNDRFVDAKVAEVVVYGAQITNLERQKIESYLALKYGLTLDQTTATDYLASDGTTKMWDATVNSSYKTDIAGIGRDDCTNLNQKQSKSVNTGNLITVALGNSLPAMNQANTSTITNDLTFLTWGHNNLTTNFATAVTGVPNATLRMNRVWRVDKSAAWADQNITICAAQAGERYLLINPTDATFASGNTEYAFTIASGGCVTINSSLLPDGAYFTLGANIVGPACVNANIKAWYRFDYGIGLNGSNIASLSDYSGNNLNLSEGTTIRQAVFVSNALNFNPAGDFTNDRLQTTLTGVNTTDPITLISVSVPDALGGFQSTIGLGDVSDHPHLGYAATDANYYTLGTTAPDNRHATALTNGRPYIIMGTANNANPKDVKISYNGTANEQTFTGATGTFPAGQGGFIALGAEPSTYGELHDGYIAEAIAYNRVLTATEKQRIYSYLALKYGITLNQSTPTNYVDNDGTVYWDATANAGYSSAIAGIGRDECTELHQRQSKSVNTGEFLTIALGSSIAASNIANTNNVTTDRSFFVWGHNNGAIDFSTESPGASATARLARVWKVDKTNWADQNITVCFGTTYANDYLIINNTNAAFPTLDKEYSLNANGCFTLNSSDLPDGAFFTVGRNLLGPGCVNGGIRVWLDANDGLTAITNGVQWSDKSGNALHVAQTTDVLEADEGSPNAAHNYNNYIDFDGNDVFETDQQVLLSANSSGSVFFVSQYRDLVGYDSPVDFDADDPHLGRLNNNLVTYMNGSSPIQFSPASLTLTTNKTHLSGYVWNGGTNGGMEMRRDALSATEPLMDFNNIGYTKDFGVGAYISGAEGIDGTMSEVIVYNKKLTAAEINRVESYLALKYGITLDQTTATNYLASDGTTEMWHNDADGFIHDIAGIGKDECTNLHQRQSKSVNTDDVVTFALGSSIAATNAANTNSVTNDKTFFSWANNDGSTNVFTTAVTTSLPNVNVRMARIWKVDKTAGWADQNVTICFTGQIGERYLLIDNDSPTLASVDNEIALNPLTGCVTVSTSVFVNNAYFSLGTEILGPGCTDNSDVLTWLRADYGATAAQWNDFSGRSTHARQVTVANQPALGGVMNFNPALDFNGSSFLNFDIVGQNLNINPTVIDRDPITVLAVYNADVLTRPVWGNDNGGNDRTFDMHQVGNGTAHTAYSGGNVTTQSKLMTALLDEGAANGSFVYADGGQVLNFTQSGSDGGLSYTMLGRSWTGYGGGTMFDGRIGEFVAYRGALTPAERQQAESYLAVKYGITLSSNNDGDGTAFETTPINEGDYVNSSAGVIWDASANQAYHNDIAGIGRDECTVLHQKQSKGVNDDDILTIGHVDIAATNAANTNDLTDGAFMLWGNNNGAATWTASNAPDGYARLSRLWHVQETGTVGNVKMRFDVADAQFDVPALINGTTYFLLYDANNNDDLTDDTPVALTDLGGNIWEATGINFDNGAEFTLATQVNSLAFGSCNNCPNALQVNEGASIVAARTGVNATVCLNCTVTNTENVVDTDTTNFGLISSDISLVGSSSISVGLQSNVPTGTRVGFVIQNASGTIGASLLDNIRVRGYANGTVTDNYLADNALVRVEILVGGTSPIYRVSFVTTAPLDELRITVESVLTASTDLRVYYAFANTDCIVPGGVGEGIVTWLRADDGTASGASWTDQTGNGVSATQGTVGNQPATTGVINFNPALLFDGADDYMSLAQLQKLPYGNSGRTIVTVGYSTNTVNNRWIFAYGTNASGQGNFWGQQGTTGNYGGGFSNDVTEANYWANNVPLLTTNTYDGTNGTIYKNNDAPTTLTRTWNTVQNVGYIGRQVNNAEYWQGGIGEVIVYNRVLTTTERQQVNSYLALKYGITLDQTGSGQNYVASDGTVYWDAATNGVYENDIAGIGLDNCTALNQKQSKSINSDERLTIALGTIAATNAANFNVFATDKSFLTWANDNGAYTEVMTDLPTAFAASGKRLAREWKVDKTGNVSGVQVQFDLTALTISAANINEIKLLIDRDGDGNFTTGTVDVVNAAAYIAGTSVTFDNVAFNDGDVFALASQLPEIRLSGKVILQGAYNTMTSEMRTDLNAIDVLPTTDPYGLGITAMTDPNTVADIVDWVKIEVRDAATSTTVLKSVAAFLKKDGTIVDIDGSSTAVNLRYLPGTYHIAIKHRNHLAIYTATAQVFSSSTPVNFDFTTSLSQARDNGTGNSMVLVGSKWSMWAGDYNQDEAIDGLDNSSVLNEFFLNYIDEYRVGDLNHDGVVDGLDVALMVNSFFIGPNSPFY
jgi:hypothetical protein